MPNYVVSPPFPRGLWKGDKGYSFGAPTAVAIAASPGGLSRAANGVVTVTTSAPHKAVPGEIATIVGSQSVGGTRFDGNYYTQAAAFGSSALTLVPVDDVILHQAPDTGGGGTVSVIQMEQPAAPQAGKAWGLGQKEALQLAPEVFNAAGFFDGAPAAFEVDIEGADSDSALTYALVGAAGTGAIPIGKIQVVDANNAFNVQITGRPNFVRMTLRSRTNAVNFAGWFTG